MKYLVSRLQSYLSMLVLVGTVSTSHAADPAEAWKLYRTGKYVECIAACNKAIEDRSWSYDWRVLLIKSLMTTGQYDVAGEAAEAAYKRYSNNIPVMMACYEAHQHNNAQVRADPILARINRLGQVIHPGFWDPPDLVALGRAALLLGAEPKLVLDELYGRAHKLDAKHRGAFMAKGELALSKEDYELASRSYQEALKLYGDDPDLHFGLAQSIFPGDRRAALLRLDVVFSINPNHIPALLMRAEHHIDAEDFDKADETLDRVLKINPNQPIAWALKSMLAELNSDLKTADETRGKALKYWPANPMVDFTIGRKLAQKYRFHEAAEHQRKALSFDPKFMRAKLQLAQDLLRLGQEDEGWALVKEVHDKDGYNVTAFNLVSLHDAMSKFTALESDHFIIRMSDREAQIYGQDLLDLLHEAKQTLCTKYGLDHKDKVIVEVFPEQEDFAIRTFGSLGGIGYLGVCFGDVITANSPGGLQTRQVNWKSVMWHEYCHVVTLNLTNNKMPRWLSEGISVYEEIQRDRRWGQHMNPRYREFVLEGGLVPVGELSGAFLNPPSGEHLEFAYYESALVVEYLVDRFGLEKLKAILKDLGEGVEMYAALTKHTAPLDQIEQEFKAFATRRATSLAPGIDWAKPDPEKVNVRDPEELARWFESHPNTLQSLSIKAEQLMDAKNWPEAKTVLERMIELYPEYAGADNAYLLLARVFREMDMTDKEIQTLQALSQIAADATTAYERLMQLGKQRQDWDAVKTAAEQYLSVNPLLPQPYEHHACACEELGDTKGAVASYSRLLNLEPNDPASVHYRLARLLAKINPAAAKRHALQALEEAPRYRDAHRLLLQLVRQSTDAKEESP